MSTESASGSIVPSVKKFLREQAGFLVPLAGLVAFLVLALVPPSAWSSIGHLSTQDSANLVAALTAISTLALVGVTAWYVNLTGKLVDGQNQSLKQAREAEEARRLAEQGRTERRAVLDVWRACHSYVYSVGYLRDTLNPLSTGTLTRPQLKEIIDVLIEEGNEMNATSAAIVANAPDLPASAVLEESLNVAARLAYLRNVGQGMAMTVTACVEEHSDGTVIPARDLATYWTMNQRPNLEGLEWDDLVSAGVYERFGVQFDRLERLAWNHLRPDAMRDLPEPPPSQRP